MKKSVGCHVHDDGMFCKKVTTIANILNAVLAELSGFIPASGTIEKRTIPHDFWRLSGSSHCLRSEYAENAGNYCDRCFEDYMAGLIHRMMKEQLKSIYKQENNVCTEITEPPIIRN